MSANDEWKKVDELEDEIAQVINGHSTLTVMTALAVVLQKVARTVADGNAEQVAKLFNALADQTRQFEDGMPPEMEILEKKDVH